MTNNHAVTALEYAKDWIEFGDGVQERWECRVTNEWLQLARTYYPSCAVDSNTQHPSWHPNAEYRRKPRMITATDATGKVWEWPEPMREKPEDGSMVYVPNPLKVQGYEGVKYYFSDKYLSNELLGSGLCHLTESAAEAHAEALIAISRGGE